VKATGAQGLQEAFDRIGEAAEHHLGSAHAAGLALAVTDGDEILGVVCRGMADVAARTPVRPETRFEIGSISKSFAAIVVLQEVEAGRLDLHVSVNEILPWLELAEPFGPVTLHHLMTHTAGLLIGTEDAATGPGALWRLRTNPPTTAPGERFLYSNDGWKVVGACLEEVTGLPTHEILKQRVIGPLGMTSTAASITDAEFADLAVGYEPMYTDRPLQLRHPLLPAARTLSNTADGSIISTVVDMSAYARLILAGGDLPDGRGGRMLSEVMFAEWTKPRVDMGLGARYGYGLWTEEVDGRRWVGHSGGMVGYTGYLVTSPEEGLAAVVLQNGGGEKRGMTRNAVALVLAGLAGDSLPPVWSPPAPTDVPKAAEYAGRYVGEDGRTLEIAADGPSLRMTIGPVSVLLEQDPLSEEPSDSFLVPHEAFERYPLTFGRDPDGVVGEAFHGDTWFRGERYAGAEPDEAPEEWRRFTGLYRNNNPWSPTVRIVLRKGRLALQWPAAASDEDGDLELVPMKDGWFAAGELRDPRRVRFLGNGAEGKAVIVEFNDAQWFRSFEE
jgi:D-alanyl-D-alanine carboxypeptidase